MAQKQSFIKTIRPVCEKLAADMGLSFYDLSLDREPAGLYLRIYIDAEGGLSLDQCEAYHRAVQPKVERYDYDFLEVCSPGSDRPVKTDRDIERALGTTVSVHLYRPQDGRKDFEGTLLKMDGEQVTVSETEGPEAVILELHVAEDDMGKVIGKQGRIARAIRTVIKAATARNAKPVFVEIQ